MDYKYRVQFMDDRDPFAVAFAEPTRPLVYTFEPSIPIVSQLAGVHKLLKAPHNVSPERGRERPFPSSVVASPRSRIYHSKSLAKRRRFSISIRQSKNRRRSWDSFATGTYAPISSVERKREGVSFSTQVARRFYSYERSRAFAYTSFSVR